jgi:glycosyltransferase involved in cell wall biosynthesis
MRIAFVQHGDYYEAYERFSRGEEETYYGQRYSVEFVEGLKRAADFVGTFALAAGGPYERDIRRGFSCAGATQTGRGSDLAALFSALERWRPTHVVLRTPIPDVIDWCLRRKIRLLPVFADSFSSRGLRGNIRNWNLSRLLNHDDIEFVGNHNLPASRTLAEIGVARDKIIPWDWPYAISPDDYPCKLGPKNPIDLAYVGSVSAAKGVPDIIAAAGLLKAAGRKLRLHIIGEGDLGLAHGAAQEAGVTAETTLHGRVANREVMRLLAASDLALIPSRHAYAEGMPKSLSEALLTRTPVVLSDHPVFVESFSKSAAARMHREADPESIAACVSDFADDKDAYRRASDATRDAWNTLIFGIEWAELVEGWLFDHPAKRNALRAATLDRVSH